MSDQPIRTYLSHSYRPEDQVVNQKLWSCFQRHGFSFSVDPPTEVSTQTHLEAMLLRSGAFVAIVNYRPETAPDHCSRFVLAEFGMAVQSRIPKLIVVDANVPTQRFDGLPDEELIRIDFEDLDVGLGRLDAKVSALAATARAFGGRPERPRNRVAFLVASDPPSIEEQEVFRVVGELAALHGMQCEPVNVDLKDNVDLALRLERYETVAMDVRGTSLPDWVFSYVYGRFLPTVRLARIEAHEVASGVALPPLVRGLQMDAAEPSVESVIFWRDDEDLETQLSKTFQKLRVRGTKLHDVDDAKTYFESIGRRPARLFISNSGRANDFADRLCARLATANIEAWQYKQRGAIEVGAPWPEAIRRELDRCDVFVALLDRDYPNKQWCRKEMRRARQRLTDEGDFVLLPFQIDESIAGGAIGKLVGELQTPPVYREGDNAPDTIFRWIDGQLRKRGAGDWRQREPALLGGARQAILDAIRHLSPDEFDKLFVELRRHGIDVRTDATESGLQSRQVAARVLDAVQRTADFDRAGTDFQSATSVLVAQLIHLCRDLHRMDLERLLRRIEANLSSRPSR